MTQAISTRTQTLRPQTLRLLVVTNMWPSEAEPVGGIFVAEQVASLRDAGLQVDVLLVGVTEGDTVTRGWRAYWHGFGQVRRALREQRYDLVHAHYVFSGILALAGRFLAEKRLRHARPPIVLTQHGIETQVGWTAPLCRLTSRLVDATIATSRRVQQALRRPDAAIIPCGVDTRLFRPMARDAARTTLSLPLDDQIVLFAGMRRPEKRFDLVEVAVAQVRAQLPRVRLVVAEHAPHGQMPLYMNAADVLILASEAEGSPMVVKEALACDLPVVSVDVGDVAAMVGGIEGCYIVERSAEGLARGLLAALRRSERIDGRKAIEEITLPAIAGQLNQLYQAVVTAHADERPPVHFSSIVQTHSRESTIMRDTIGDGAGAIRDGSPPPDGA